MNKSRLHILVLLFSLTVTIFLFPREKLYAASSGTCGAEGDNLTWTLDDEGTLTISGTGEMGSWISFHSPWNNYKSEIKKVVIGEGVTSISDYAFFECLNLSDVEISDSVTYIGFQAFCSCTSLEEIEIPGTVKTIDGSFSDCSNLKKVVLSEGLVTIGTETFSGCYSLQEIVIPEGVTSIGEYAFSYCISLQEVVISEGVTSIGDNAFDNCYALQEIVIPEGVTSIGDGAFRGCNSLQEIVISEGVTLIGNYAFEGCEALQEIVIPEGVTSIGDGAFFNCNSLQKVVIPESVTLIGEYAFWRCEELQDFVIPESVTSIGEEAFFDCGKLQDIIIPESVTSIGEGAFKACRSLTNVYISKKLYDELDLDKVFENSSEENFNVCSFTTDGNGTVSLKRVDFKYRKCYLKVVPNENFVVNEIYRIDSSGTAEPMDYYYDNGECYFEIPESEMNNLTFHATFKRVSAIVTFCSEDGTKILQSGTYDIDAIPSYTEDIPVKEPDGDNTYVFAGWSDGTVTYGVDDQLPAVTDDVIYTAVFEEVCTTITGTCGAEGDNLTWTLDDKGTLTISGTGKMGKWDYDCSPWYEYRKEIKKVVIGDGVTNISDFAFFECSNLGDVKISDSVTYIGNGAFDRCTSLEEVEIPGSVTTIDGSFSDCSNLKKVVLSEGLVTIGEKAFYECKSLQEIVIPEGVTSIGNGAFIYCSSLKKVEISESVTMIGQRAFAGCKNLQDLVIPEKMNSIGEYAFYDCNSLQEVVIPEGVTSIGMGTFKNCYSLQEVVFPESILLIDYSAFADCPLLNYLVIPKNVTTIGNKAFSGCGNLKYVFIPKTLYNGLDLKNVFGNRSEELFYLYSCTCEGNGTVRIKGRNLDSDVFLNVVPNENYRVVRVTITDSSGTSFKVKGSKDNWKFNTFDHDLTIYATFTRVRANITFCSEDGTNILQSGTYKINEIPSYTEDIPVKDSDGDTTYVFAGWSDGTVTYGINDQLPKVTDDVTYTAVFEEVPQSIPPVSLYKLSSIEGEDKRADIIFRINRNEDDENCISYFRSVAVDDVVLANGTQFSVEKGSTVITLKSDYLKTLSEGEHTITVNFKDGAVTASFNNLKRDAESIPATGETAIKATVGVVLVLAAVSGLAVVLIKRKKSEK